MGQYDHAINELAAGREVELRPRGQSMRPRIESGARVRLGPVVPEAVDKDDVVLVKVRGRIYLHRVAAVEGDRVQIANMRGHVNGWAARSAVYGRVVAVDNSAR
jgi:hypothetical protein